MSHSAVALKSQSIGSLIKSRKDIHLSTSASKQVSPPEKTNGQTQQNEIEERKNGSRETGSRTEETVKKAYANRKQSIAPRSHKHAPIEITSKKPVTRKRMIVDIPKVERRDPRFDSLSGAVNDDLHERSFGFLKEQRQIEIDHLRQNLQKAKKSSKLNPAQLEALQDELRREENREVQRQKTEWEKQALRKWKAEEKAKRKEGKGAFYLKRKAQKEIILTDRYEHLSQNKSKLHKSIEKKRKKVDGKEKKSMPIKRQRPSD